MLRGGPELLLMQDPDQHVRFHLLQGEQMSSLMQVRV